MATTIEITPWDGATFADSTFVLVAVTPEVGQEYLYDYKDFTFRIDDISEIERNREDDECEIEFESGLSHSIPYDPANVTVTIGGVTPTSNENMRDLLMAIRWPRYVAP